MKVKLDDKLTFNVEYKQDGKTATFTFNHNTWSLYILATERFSKEAQADSCQKDLVKIEGLETEDGEVKVSDFHKLPITIYAHVLAEYDKKLAEKLKDVSDEKKD